jgi:TRAP-type C4-dicarboxylate transport system permease small subunit
MKQQQYDKLFGIFLTKKRAYIFLVLGIISLGFFMLLYYYSLELLLEARDIYVFDASIYYKILLIGFSNFILSFVFMGIFSYALQRIRQFLFRKSPKSKND